MHHPPSSSAGARGRHAFPALLAANLFLAFGPWAVRLSDVGPVAAGFWRLALAVPLLLLIVRMSGERMAVPPRMALVLAVAGMFFAADLGAWHYGIVRTKLANATLFGNFASFVFVIYGFVIARAMPRPVQATAFLLAAVGTILLLGNSYELSPEHLEGDLFSILAGLFYFGYLVCVDRARRTLAPMPLLTLVTIAGAPPLLLFALMLGEPVLPTQWTPLVLLSLGSQVIGQGLLVYSIGHLSPLVVGLGLLTQPAVTALIGWLAYDERLTLTDGLGAVMICAALVLIRLPARSDGGA